MAPCASSVNSTTPSAANHFGALGPEFEWQRERQRQAERTPHTAPGQHVLPLQRHMVRDAVGEPCEAIDDEHPRQQQHGRALCLSDPRLPPWILLGRSHLFFDPPVHFHRQHICRILPW